MNAIRVTVEFTALDTNEVTTVVFDSRDQKVEVDGTLWPVDLSVLQRIIRAARDERRQYDRIIPNHKEKSTLSY
jgi:hypothetical protein